jgi:hypothetical protein
MAAGEALNSADSAGATYDASGVDGSLVRWMLRQSPAQRLAYAQGVIDLAAGARRSGNGQPRLYDLIWIHVLNACSAPQRCHFGWKRHRLRGVAVDRLQPWRSSDAEHNDRWRCGWSDRRRCKPRRDGRSQRGEQRPARRVGLRCRDRGRWDRDEQRWDRDVHVRSRIVRPRRTRWGSGGCRRNGPRRRPARDVSVRRL